MDAVLVIVLMVLVPAGWLWWAWRSDQRKIARYTAHAKQLGCAYVPNDEEFLRHWDGTPLDMPGGRIQDIFTTVVRGLTVHVFEYTYKQRVGKNTRTVEFVVAAAQLPVALPETEILHETAGRKLTKMLGARDIQFESSAFNDAFLVRGTDERTTHALVDPRMMEFLLNSPARDLQIRIVDDWVLMWQPETLFFLERLELPEAVEPVADLLAQFIEQFPKHLLRR